MVQVFVIISILQYIFAPIEYSYGYAVFVFATFILNVLAVAKMDAKFERIGFNFLFTLSFFLVNYIYPVFIYPVFPTFSLFIYEINYDVIMKATALANVAYSFYGLGYIVHQNREFNERICKTSLRTSNILPEPYLWVLAFMCAGLFVIFFAGGGYQHFVNTYGEDSNIQDMTGLIALIFTVLTTLSVLVTILNLNYRNLFVYTFLLLATGLLAKLGSRTLPLCVMSVIFCYVCNKYKVSKKKIFVFIGVAFVLLALLGRSRGGGEGELSVDEESVGMFRVALDFIVANRNLYAIYDHVQTDSITWGVSLLAYILAAVPFSQGIVSQVFNIPDYAMRSETLTTYWELGDAHGWGLGTNIVGDVYLALGLFGVIFLFYGLGYVVAYSREQMYKGSRIWKVFYYMMIAGSIFMGRGSIFYSFKNIAWSFVIVRISNAIRLIAKKAHDSSREKQLEP